MFHDHNLTGRIVEAVVQVNNAQKSWMVKKIWDALKPVEYGKKAAFFGLTFKPETDDIREAPSLTIIPALQEKGVSVHATDPRGMEETKKILKDVDYFENPYEAAEGVDAVVIMTEWNEYRALDLEKLKKVMRGNIFIDLKNVYDPQKIRSLGFIYTGVGVL